MNWQEFVKHEKASRDTIDTKRAYIMMAGDIAAGVLLSQIMYWHLPGNDTPTRLTVEHEGHLWLAKKRHDWWDEICMLPKQFDRTVKTLEKRHLVKTKLFRFDGSPTKHLRVIWDVFLEVYDAIISKENISFDAEGGKWIFPIREYRNSQTGNIENFSDGAKSDDDVIPAGTEFAFKTTYIDSIPVTKNVTGAPRKKKKDVDVQPNQESNGGEPNQTQENPSGSQKQQTEPSKRLLFVQAVVEKMNKLQNKYPDRVRCSADNPSAKFPIPRKEATLSQKKHSTACFWFDSGKDIDDVCDALETWVKELKPGTVVSSPNYFRKKPFPQSAKKEADKLKRMIEKTQAVYAPAGGDT
jgi:hypothetical protein